MDSGSRLTNVEVEVETCKDGIEKIEHALADMRREGDVRFRWLIGLIITNMCFTFGIVVRLAGVGAG